MQVRRSLAGAFGLGFALLALAPASAWAAEAPVVSSLTPNEIGSHGVKVIIHGERFTPTSVVHYGGIPLIVLEPGAEVVPVGDSVERSATEIEFNAPFEEHGKRLVQVCNLETAPEACSSSTLETERNQMTIWPEIYKNEAAVGAAKVPNIGYGELQLNSPQILTQIECVNVGFGSGWNEAPSGQTSPISGHGEILVWWASGHTPKSPHTELSSRCRFIFHGGGNNEPTLTTEWATAEPPLHTVVQEAVVCIDPTKKLSECENEAEREGHATIIREVTREAPSLPWNVQFTERSEKVRVRIGLPLKCKPSERTELTEGTEELERCPEASEREVSKSPARCNIPPTPAPPGCVKVQMLSNPPLNIHMEYEGYLEPLVINSGPNGLSPSSWEFEGTEKGEPTLHLRETPTTEGSTTGNVKILGFSGQELMTAK